jgi:hypothetical protein
MSPALCGGGQSRPTEPIHQRLKISQRPLRGLRSARSPHESATGRDQPKPPRLPTRASGRQSSALVPVVERPDIFVQDAHEFDELHTSKHLTGKHFRLAAWEESPQNQNGAAALCPGARWDPSAVFIVPMTCRFRGTENSLPE